MISSTLDHPPIVTTWPPKADLFGVGVSVTTYEEAAAAILAAAEGGRSAVVSCHAVHALVTAARDPALREKVNQFAMVTPDGQPVRWALNVLHGAGLPDRVYGPELMLRLCRGAEARGLGIYLYGGTPATLERLCANLLGKFPGLRIAGRQSPPFRPLLPEESRDLAAEIRGSGAGLVFIGLGCPKQDHFAFDHQPLIDAVQVCVGAAFDFHAGVKSVAPRWMQRSGLEWLFRLAQEPRRLASRYLVTNSVFLTLLGKAMLRRVFRPLCRSCGKPRVQSTRQAEQDSSR
jgi:exopolysaccharide biosynthesis WecB/TagA/CpsF family protein